MATLTKRPQFTIAGTWTASDPENRPVEFRTGDVAPDWLVARLTKGELSTHLREGRLLEVGAKPAPRAPEPPPRPLTVAETLGQFGFEDDPPGTELIKVQKVRPDDFKRVLDLGRDTPILVHPVDEVPCATLTLGALAQLLAGRGLMR